MSRIKTMLKPIDTHCSSQAIKETEKNHCMTHSITMVIKLASHSQPNNEFGVSKIRLRLLALYSIMIAYKAASTLWTSITWSITSLNVTDKSKVVYKINCTNCETNIIGETETNWRHDFMNTSVQVKVTKNGP